MVQSISVSSIILMAAAAFLSIVVPIGAAAVLGIKKLINWKAVLYGSLFFFVFALIFENLLHRFVLGVDPMLSPIYRSTFWYTLYGGFAAGIFEETSRLLGFKLFFASDDDKKYLFGVTGDEAARIGISYGLGHGGVESLMLGGLSAVTNLVAAIMLNSGSLGGMTASMTAEQLESFRKGINTLASTPSYVFLLSGVERVIALVLQVSLSFFVLKTVLENRWTYFVSAVLLHAVVDMLAILYKKGAITSILLLEGIVLILAAAVAAVALRIRPERPDVTGTRGAKGNT